MSSLVDRLVIAVIALAMMYGIELLGIAPNTP